MYLNICNLYIYKKRPLSSLRSPNLTPSENGLTIYADYIIFYKVHAVHGNNITYTIYNGVLDLNEWSHL